MIEVTSFLLKHLYELMADNYAVDVPAEANQRANEQAACSIFSYFSTATPATTTRTRRRQVDVDAATQQQQQQQQLDCHMNQLSQVEREQETNQQIVSFLTYNQLPDLACETFIELLFICVFLAISWIFVMIVQLHWHQPVTILNGTGQQPAVKQYHSARQFYCQTRILNSLMYCNNPAAHFQAL